VFKFNSPATRSDKNALRDHFVEHAMLGIDIKTALDYTLADATAEIAQAVAGGGKLTDLLSTLGISTEKADPISLRIEKVSSAHGQLSYAALRAAIGGADVVVIPTAECIHNHLPKGAKPTRELIQKAWDACTKK
jgi:hypothetical protein